MIVSYFLSVVQLNPSRRSARHVLSSRQRLHAFVLGAFPSLSEGDRVLWRLDVDGHKTVLVIASPVRPDLTHIVEEAGYPQLSDETARCVDISPVLGGSLSEGQSWKFRLTANPTKSIRRAPGERGQRVGLHRAEDQVEWLNSRGSECGFRVVDAVVTKNTQDSFRRGTERQNVTLRVVQFDGVLEITDAKRFADHVMQGFGHGRAYGCGLLTLSR